jgi:hypothetical protein
MTTNSWQRFFVVAAWIVIGAFQAVETFAAEDSTINFDDVTQGQLPTGWTIDATNSGGARAEWSVVTDSNAPSKPNVLTLKTVQIRRDLCSICAGREISPSRTVRSRSRSGPIPARKTKAAELSGVQGCQQLLHRPLQSARKQFPDLLRQERQPQAARQRRPRRYSGGRMVYAQDHPARRQN